MVFPVGTARSRQGRAISSAGERFVHTEEVTGSIPVSPTTDQRSFPTREAASFAVRDVRPRERNGSALPFTWAQSPPGPIALRRETLSPWSTDRARASRHVSECGTPPTSGTLPPSPAACPQEGWGRQRPSGGPQQAADLPGRGRGRPRHGRQMEATASSTAGTSPDPGDRSAAVPGTCSNRSTCQPSVSPAHSGAGAGTSPGSARTAARSCRRCLAAGAAAGAALTKKTAPAPVVMVAATPVVSPISADCAAATGPVRASTAARA